MEESLSSANKAEPSSGTASNLDSFFKRLGQGQGSRLWTGPGRASGAVPGSLRTHFQPRSDDVTNTPASTAASRSAAGPSKAGRIPSGSDRRPGALTAPGNSNETAHSVGVGTDGAAGIGNELKRPDGDRGDDLLSPPGTSRGWKELEGGVSIGRTGPPGHRGMMSSSSASGSGGGSEIGGHRGSNGSNGTAFASDNPLMSAPVSPSPAPPSSTNSVQPPKPTGAGAVTGAVTPRKPAPKPAAKPIAKPAISTTPSPVLANRPSYRDKRFAEVLGEDIVKLDELRKLSWNGVPQVHRAAVWQLLVGYMPANRSRRAVAMERKRREYREAVPQYFDVPDAARSHQEQNLLRQILVDVPRTCPDVPFFHQDKVQRAMERILYIWAIRHPASGYVQGINDIMTPLYVVFLSAHVGPSVESKDVGKVEEVLLDEVEADVYWCLTKLLDNIQDHYTAMQPGLQRMVLRLEELVQRIDAELHRHITEQGLMYIQFAFRWMNCLLMRELPLRAVVRAWDTYLTEENGFESFQVYVSAALLCHFSSTLREMDFQTMVMFLQDMPTKEWGEEQVEPLLSQAYILSMLFEGSPNHLGA